ncbi:hypothetical protein DdX_02023 [Ditylenchus destructor]|uniref:Uncharacterized protein n=1 Tax=Ditylenchus destructor TaxID=166010 RepID=A0AAD4NFD0_9BILA|nr:hypothetical protein DdX_02023 [Ditylenchus destructor]
MQGDNKSNRESQDQDKEDLKSLLNKTMQNQTPSTSQLPSFFQPMAANFPMSFLSQQSSSALFSIQQQLVRQQAENAPGYNPGPDSTTRDAQDRTEPGRPLANNWHTQNWMQNHIYNLYSPSPSNAPSLMSYASAHSLPDDASTTSHMSSLSNFKGTSFLPNPMSLDPNKPNAENLDPKRSANQTIDSFISSLADSDPDVRQKCIDILRQSSAKGHILYLPASPEKIKNLILSLVVLITDAKRISPGYEQHRLLLIIIHQFLTMPDPIGHLSKAAARNERFILHLLNIMKITKKSDNILFFAIASLRDLMFKFPEWKQFVVNKGGMEMLLGFLDVSKYHFKERRAAIRCLYCLISQNEIACKFVHFNGIEVLTESVFKDLSPEIIYEAMRCLLAVSDLKEIQEIKEICIVRTLELAIKVIVNSHTQAQDSARQLLNVRNAIWITSNVLCNNSSAKKCLTLMKEPRALEFIISTAWQCTQIGNENNKKSIANEILDGSLVALSIINRKDNPEGAQASKLIATNQRARELFQLLMLSSNTACQRRIISCWYQMSLHGVTPTHFIVPTMMLKFIVERVEEVRRLKEAMTYKEECKYFREVNKAIISLGHLSEGCAQHSETIIGLINEGRFDPFVLISKLTNEDVCINMLAFLEYLSSKEFTLRTKWAQDKTATQMLHLCAQSPNNKLSEISAKLLKQIEFGTEDYVSPLYDAFNGQMEF